MSSRQGGLGDRPGQHGGLGGQSGDVGGAWESGGTGAFQGLGQGSQVRSASDRGAASRGGEMRATGGGDVQSRGAGSRVAAAVAGSRGVVAAAVVVVVAAAVVAAADVGEASVVGRTRVIGSFSLYPHQDGCRMSHTSIMSEARYTGPFSTHVTGALGRI